MIGISDEECVRLIQKELQGFIHYGRGGVITIQNNSAFQSRIAELEQL